MKSVKWLVMVAVLVCAGPASAATDDVYAGINKRAVEQHIIPRYSQLAAATGNLATSAKSFCAAPDATGLDRLKDAYGAAVDAWQSIQHIRFGPVNESSRADRIAFWPDPRNIIGKQMAAFLAKHDAAALEAQRFTAASVALQGLPALERLMFTDQSARLMTGDADAAFRCQYLEAITGNLAMIAAQISQEWSKTFAGQMLQPASGVYRGPREANVDLFKSLFFAIELAADHKLARPLGVSTQEARPRLAEAWRSQRSLRNIRVNLEAAQSLYIVAFSPAVPDRGTDDGIRAAFDEAMAAASQVAMPLEEAVQNEAMRPAVEKLARSTLALKKILLHLLPAELNIPVGFNALDGD